MIYHKVNPQDDRYLFLCSDKEEEMKELIEYLNKIPQFQFLPSYSGIPKPEVHLDFFKKGDKKIYYCFSGLYLEILYWCRAHQIKTTITEELFYRKPKHTLAEFINIISSLVTD